MRVVDRGPMSALVLEVSSSCVYGGVGVTVAGSVCVGVWIKVVLLSSSTNLPWVTRYFALFRIIITHYYALLPTSRDYYGEA